ncbi:DUF7331 family protein [Halococcoides cellulosivorans]|uniref:Uncharacterized protein n=1 Tax=Halococcoides cellulosivorans TaxID=1679096 RepID=A0A2R4X0Z1_9EURY|nr:hypothetical protein [Halococcoides cellulosivorans]AWB27441.1 hypothetical protein HARCEL1_06845 [Halococcoides cellulosivorans]
MSDRMHGQAVEEAHGANAVEPAAIRTVEGYRTDDRLVLQDASDPLAWIESSAGIDLDDML